MRTTQSTNLLLEANSFLSRRGFHINDFNIEINNYDSKHKLLKELMKKIKRKDYVAKKKKYEGLPTYVWSNKNVAVTITCSIEELSDKYKINPNILKKIVDGKRKQHRNWKLAS